MRSRIGWLVALAFCGCGSAAYAQPGWLTRLVTLTELDETKEANGIVVDNGHKPAKVLLDWNLGPEAEEEEETEEPLATDRPDFVEASSNVGLGRVQLELGYTFVRDRSNGDTTELHSYPEALLRIGIFADWLELRIGQNFATEINRSDGVRTSDSGAEDLYLGLGIALTEQKGIFPESRLILQTTVPSGCHAFSGRQVLPGLNYLYSWDITDKWSLAMSSGVDRARDEGGHIYAEFSQGITTGISLTEKLGTYLETFAFFPAGALVATPEYYLDGGFVYRLTNNLQFDVRGGVGLNRHADDFFVGSGFAVRY